MNDPNTGSESEDQTRALLRAADPARSLAPADPTRVSALLEETMSQSVNVPQQGPNRTRWLLGGVAAAAAVATVVTLGITGSEDPSEPELPSAAATSSTTGTDPGSTGDSGSVTELTTGPAIAVKCAAPSSADAARQSVAFEGTVTKIVDGVVTLKPTEFFTGPATSLVTVAAPDQNMSEAPAEFVVGEDYIVGASGGRVAICGLTGPADDDLRALYEDAFGK